MVGARRGGGSMPLPRISGFSEEFFFSHKLTSDEEHLMSSKLGRNRYQKGNRAARSYANLVVLFRMLLFYKPLKHHENFWEWVSCDWGLGVEDNLVMVRGIANFYADARYAALSPATSEQRISLLVSLVDEWLLIRPRPEIGYAEDVDTSKIQATRSAWLNIRDYHVDMLMDRSLPASLAGVQLPTKVVTSLWEEDPEIVALFKVCKTNRKPRAKNFTGRVGSTPKPPAGPKPVIERKRKVSLSEGEIDEREPATSNDSTYDERCFTPLWEDARLAPTPTEQVRKRSQPIRSSFLLEHHRATESSDAFDLIDLTSPMRPSSAPAREPIPPPPPPPHHQQHHQQVLPKPSPALVQSKLTQFANSLPAMVASSIAAAASAPAAASSCTMNAVSDRRQDLSTQLQRMAGQMRHRQDEMRARVEVETTGCVPLVPHRPSIVVAGGHLAAEERELYEARLREVEGRVAALERTHHDEAGWSRAMGRFLYDANDRSVRALQDIVAAIDTLEKASSALLEGEKRKA